MHSNLSVSILPCVSCLRTIYRAKVLQRCTIHLLKWATFLSAGVIGGLEEVIARTKHPKILKLLFAYFQTYDTTLFLNTPINISRHVLARLVGKYKFYKRAPQSLLLQKSLCRHLPRTVSFQFQSCSALNLLISTSIICLKISEQSNLRISGC